MGQTVPREQRDESRRKSLRDRIEKMLQKKPDDFVRQAELGELSFAEALPYIEGIFRLLRELRTACDNELPPPIVSAGQQVTLKIQTQLDSAEKLKISEDQAQQKRDTIINELEKAYGETVNYLGPVISIFKTESLTLWDGRIKEYEVELGTLRQNIETVKDTMRQTAQDVGVSVHARYYHEEAAKHDRSARNWLIISAGLALGTIGVLLAHAAWNILGGTGDTWTAEALGRIAAKILGFTTLLSGIVWSGNNYRAHRHNNVVNRQRANALSTFQAFATAAADPETKRAILLQATACIFMPQQTGYASKDRQQIALPSVLDMVMKSGPQQGK